MAECRSAVTRCCCSSKFIDAMEYVSADGPSGGIGRICVGHRNGGACANSASGQDVFGS